MNVVDLSHRNDQNYEFRLFKYSKRGFSVAIPNFNKNKLVNKELIEEASHATSFKNPFRGNIFFEDSFLIF